MSKFPAVVAKLLFPSLFMLSLLAGCGGGGGGGGSSSSAPTIAAPAITTQPQSLRVADGQAATFSVTVTSAVAASYQWSRGGSAIAGATAATYSIPTAQLSDDGAVFSVVVANPGGSVQSTNATLNVSPVAPSIANNVATNIAVTAGQPATFAVVVAGSAPLTFQWRRGGAAIAGATSASFTLPATVLSDNGATFDVVVSNAAGSVTSALFTLTVTTAAQAPGIATQPQSQTVTAGSAASFSVVASGTAPFTYQWLRDGTAIAGAQASTYTVAAAALTDNNARFSVTVGNAAGTITSSAAILSVTPRVSLALVAGDIGGQGTIDGNGIAARFFQPSSVALDNAGNAYVADASTVRKLTPGGVVTTFAGSPTTTGSVDGTGAAARFGTVSGVAVDPSGNVFVADSTNHTIRRITPAGVVTTIAGTSGTSGSSDGSGGAALFNGPNGLASDATGNLYVADTGNQTIRRIATNGVVTTFAGTAGVAGASDGTGAAASFSTPIALAVDASSNVYVADLGNSTIRRITPAGVVTTVAGTAGQRGPDDGTGAAARFNAPFGLAVDGSGNLYVGDGFNREIRKVTPAGVVTTLAGSPGVVGGADGSGPAAAFSAAVGVASDASGTLTLADRDNFAIRTVTPSGVVNTIAGARAISGSADGARAGASFLQPYGVAVDASGNLYVTDSGNLTIRRITSAGVVTTLAGTAGLSGSADGTGPAARFGSPLGIAVDAAGTTYVADQASNTIRRITAAGVVTTLAGDPLRGGSADGTGSAATFNAPNAIAVDAAGNLFVTDAQNATIRRITPAGVVTTFAGTAGQIGSRDGTGASATFSLPSGIAIDASGNLYVSDRGSSIVRRITPAGVVTTLAGTPGVTGAMDGVASTATFSSIVGIAVDRSGNVYVADAGNRTIRKIDTTGTVSTPVGVADGRSGVRLGVLPGALNRPFGVAVDVAGNLYITDVNGVLMVPTL